MDKTSTEIVITEEPIGEELQITTTESAQKILYDGSDTLSGCMAIGSGSISAEYGLVEREPQSNNTEHSMISVVSNRYECRRNHLLSTCFCSRVKDQNIEISILFRRVNDFDLQSLDDPIPYIAIECVSRNPIKVTYDSDKEPLTINFLNMAVFMLYYNGESFSYVLLKHIK